jgi:GNAT superfamily N-acetyltransferase
MTTAIETMTATKDQIAECGEVLARAFHDDPLMEYIVPDDAKRARWLRWFMTKGAHYAHHYGQVDTTGAKVEGGAIWLPPDDVKLTVPRMARTGMLAFPLKFGFGTFRRFLSAMNHAEHLHDRDLPERHWYLLILGVDPPRQGQGVGGALMQPILARADDEGLPCYLETAKARNVSFYEKHGFEVIVESDLPNGGPHFWTMKRLPRA